MSSTLLFSLTAAALFGLALHALITARHLLRKLIAANVMSSSVFLVLVAMARRAPDGPDPVPHAMVLTGIVVTVAVTGLALAILRRSVTDGDAPRLPEDDPERE